MKTTMIILCFVLLNLLSSCGEKGQRQSKKNGLEVNQITNCINTVDSLKKVIENISYTNYDLIVIKLKSLPEYKNALFLTPKENADYLRLVQQNSEKFKIKRQYLNISDEKWTSCDDTTQSKGGWFVDCKILFDTTQTIKPILVLTNTYANEFKHKKTKEERSVTSSEVYNYYYIPKFRVGYVIANDKIFSMGKLIYDSYRGEYNFLDEEIRSGFMVRKNF